MLQQTQVSRGLPKYLEFIQKFPKVADLASASPSEVLRAWRGLGYNRRALYLHNSAKMIVKEWKGQIPDDEAQLMRLPGLGKYTARAILVFAFMKDLSMVDTNIRQIIMHFFFHDSPQPEKLIQEVADQLVPKGKSWEWHQALMDYGALAIVRSKKRNEIKKTKPFKETNRYFRGRLIDVLREKSYKEKELVKLLCSIYGKDDLFFMDLLEHLEKEGLIEKQKQVWRLPV